MEKKIIIIGAGISGLCAGCYLQMNGYETEIFELHSLPGGLCTAWEKQGYTFDGCIHWLVGSKPETPFYKLWSELVNMKKLTFYEGEEYFRIIDKQNKPLVIYRNVDKLEQSLLSIATDKNDISLVKDFCKAVRKLNKLKMPVDKARETMNMFNSVKMLFNFLPYYRDLNKWMKISAGEYAAKFSNPLLKQAFELMFIPEMSMLFLVFTIVWMSNKDAGYPIGGSLNFAKLIEKRYLELNGKIHYNSRVDKIITESDIAKGIVLTNGDQLFADIVISAADGHETIYSMLDGKYTDITIENIYNNYLTFPSYLQVSLGIGRSLEDQQEMQHYFPDNPIRIDDQTQTEHVSFRIFNFDKSMSPSGKTSVVSVIGTRNYKYWVNLKKSDPELYKSEKKRIADALINLLDSKIGNIKEYIEVIDVSTPSTVIRYTNNWKGSLEGWLLTPQVGLKTISKTLPGLNNFYQIGQWVEPGGGLPSCIQSGRGIAQIICKKDKKKFSSSLVQ